ncbi:hypothetical protein COU60_04385 [Candidatus Pacearchaeota archaeon CG10_big_fil_rev_8_21_14_0_10_34_76]|nr:MAG: hypothetical protein COU60_04385 [Candidatus Pacearchaeota archaeon CG10_big_fil_rev_8_21_14_0_10_34_76]
MNIDFKRLVNEKRLRPRETNKDKIKSLVESAKNNVDVVSSLPINEKNATVIFREIYESIRQLGDARFWILGYEPLDHAISLDSLKDLNIKYKVKLNYLDRFKQIRHDANYRGFNVSASQAQEILDFWNVCSQEIIEFLLKK